MKIVVVAGADRTGKSTLTKEFTRCGWKYRHFGPPKGSPYVEYRGFADALASNGNPDGKYIVDRYMYCEFPYSKHYGRETDMTIWDMNAIEETLLMLDPSATIVYCETDLESNWKRIQDEGKGEFKSIEELVALKAEYERVLSKSRFRVLRYDFTKGDAPATFVSAMESR